MEENPSKDVKIIPLPNLELRLLERGRDLLEQRDYREATNLLLQAKTIDEENPDILYTLTAAYIQQNQFVQAREILENMLHLGIGDYFETVELYVGVLFQLHEYKKISSMLTMLLDEQQIPVHKMDQYQELLQLSLKLANEDVELNPTKQVEHIEDLFSGSLPEIIEKITSLDYDEILYHQKEIESYLVSEDGSPYIKTFLLHALHQNGYEQHIVVTKYGRTITLSVSDYYQAQDAPFPLEVKQILESMLFHENPSVLDYTYTLANRFFFSIYPLEKEFTDPNLWAEAIHAVVNLYMEGNVEQQAELLNGDSNLNNEMQQAQKFILEVEKSLHE